MQSTTLTHAKLRLSESNVRKANGDAGLEALAASIAEHGLLQPLIVSPSAGKKTLYDVHAGGRRWRAIGLLIERGVLPKDYAIDVRLCENEDAAAREISLAENLIREAMTPADEARAYRDIVDGGADAEAVARRFRRDGPPCAGPPSPCRSGRADLRRAGCGRDHARCRTGLWLDRRP
jgi:ParB family chromosome partitioning protein